MSALEINAKVKGKFRVQKRNVDTGDIYYDSGEFNNTILNNYFADSSGSFVQCSTGTDSTVNVSDTSLTQLGGFQSNPTTSDTFSVDGSGLLTFTITRVWTFAAGAIVGNMSCIGIGSSASFTGTNLKIKSLIKDVNGSPTTIPATATDQIIITHNMIITMNQMQDLGNIVVDGVNYNVKFYCCNKSTLSGSICPPYLPVLSYNTPTQTLTFKASATFAPPTIPNALANADVTLPSPFIAGSSTAVSFQAGSGLTSAAAVWAYTMAANSNLTGDAPIKAIGFSTSTSGTSCRFAYEFTPALPKNSSIAYTFTAKLNLSRA